MSSLLTVGVAVSCIVMGSFACNYDNSMCESDYEIGQAKGDCYVDKSNAFENKVIGACVDTCDPDIGDLRKCENFCKAFQLEGKCMNVTTPGSTASNQPLTFPVKQWTAIQQNSSSPIPLWIIVLCAVLATLVVSLGTAVICLLCERRTRRNEQDLWQQMCATSRCTGPDVENPVFELKKMEPITRLKRSSGSNRSADYLSSSHTIDSGIAESRTGTLQRPAALTGVQQADSPLAAQATPFLDQS